MAYNWAQLAFVEKWRRRAVRGRLVGTHRPDDKTYFDLRLYPGEGGVGQLPGSIDLHLVDAGDLVREKRMGLLDRAVVVVRIVASAHVGAALTPPASVSGLKRSRHWLEAGTAIFGNVLRREDDTFLLDIGFPVVVEYSVEGDHKTPQEGQFMEFTVSQTPQGFFVV